MKSSSVLSFLAGTAVGTAIGLLVAPNKEELKGRVLEQLEKFEKLLDTKEKNYE